MKVRLNPHSVMEEQTEAKFLHQIASPLMIAILHCQSLLEDVQVKATEEGQRRLPKLEKSLMDLKNLLEQRRSLIHRQD